MVRANTARSLAVLVAVALAGGCDADAGGAPGQAGSTGEPVAAVAGAGRDGGASGAAGSGRLRREPGERPREIGQPEIPSPDPAAPTAAALIAHEWGTFTSLQGSDGVTLEGLHHEDEPLPPFVHGRCSAMPSCLHPGQKSVEEIPEGVTQKLETPVIYFYSEQARQISVEVDFPEGVISQWFPDAASFRPALGEMGAIADGSMQWLVTVDPALDGAGAPWVPEHDIWAPARRTKATPLAVGAEREGFIFYRGVGRFELPVRVTSEAGGGLRVANLGDEALPGVFLMRTDGEAGGVVALGALGGGQQVEAQVPPLDLGRASFVAASKALLGEALAASGLYGDEAQAMVDTWERSWFGTPGVRVLYVVPRGWTDALLPIRIDPQPDALVRTLIGRIEVLTPEVEAATVEAVKAGYAGKLGLRAEGDERFFEPRLRRACALLAGTAMGEYCAGEAEHAAEPAL
ncbi:MAG: hypothetical protein R3F39_23260 [Myxococcota bacterium]